MPTIRDASKLRAYERAWYARNRSKVIKKVKAKRNAVKEWFRDYKSTLECVRCGEDDPVCLDFHHRDPSKKDFSIYECGHRAWGKARILAEIAKCDVLCANCHRKKHRDLKEGRNAIPTGVESRQLLLFPDLNEEPLDQER